MKNSIKLLLAIIILSGTYQFWPSSVLAQFSASLEIKQIYIEQNSNQLIIEAEVNNRTDKEFSNINYQIELYQGEKLAEEGDIFKNVEYITAFKGRAGALGANGALVFETENVLPDNIDLKSNNFFIRFFVLDSTDKFLGATYTTEPIPLLNEADNAQPVVDDESFSQKSINILKNLKLIFILIAFIVILIIVLMVFYKNKNKNNKIICLIWLGLIAAGLIMLAGMNVKDSEARSTLCNNGDYPTPIFEIDTTVGYVGNCGSITITTYVLVSCECPDEPRPMIPTNIGGDLYFKGQGQPKEYLGRITQQINIFRKTIYINGSYTYSLSIENPSASCGGWNPIVEISSSETYTITCTSCTSHAYGRCENNNIYWYDSCNNQQEIKESCVDYCNNETFYDGYCTSGSSRCYYRTYLNDSRCRAFPANNPPNIPELIAPADDVWLIQKPAFQARVSDPDNDKVQGIFEIDAPGTTDDFSGIGNQVFSNNISSLSAPDNKLNNACYNQWVNWRAKARDEHNLDGAYSLYNQFKIDRTIPTNTINYPTGVINGPDFIVNLGEADDCSGIATGDADVQINPDEIPTPAWQHQTDSINDFTYIGEPGACYKFRYRARDIPGAVYGNWSNYSEGGIVCINQAPVASASSDKLEYILGDSIYLDGSASYDPDERPSPLTYHWTIIKPDRTINEYYVVSPAILADQLGSYQVFLEVSDGLLYDSVALLLEVKSAGGPICGNSATEAPEECDDGNLIDNDGCSSACELESGAWNFRWWEIISF